MHITNVVATSNLSSDQLDLRRIAKENWNICYNPGRFPAVVWRPRCTNGFTVLLFRTGKIILLGKPDTNHPRVHIRRIARLLQKQGHPVTKVGPVRIVTRSAVHKLSGPISLEDVVIYLNATFESEILNAAIFKRGRVTYTVFQKGTVVITGVKNSDSVYPILLELETLCQ